jgi:hypothetical protein
LWPIETLFRCYHYEEQYRAARKSGETDKVLRRLYPGVCVQSNWDKDLDYGQKRKSVLSKLVRTIKRRIFGRLV